MATSHNSSSGHGKHAEHVKKVEEAFARAGGGAAGLTAALKQVVAHARGMQAEQAKERAELDSKHAAINAEAMDHLEANLADMVSKA